MRKILLLLLAVAVSCTATPKDEPAVYEAPPYSLLPPTTEEWTDAHQAAFEAFATGSVLAELDRILSTTTVPVPPTTFAPPTTVTKSPPPTVSEPTGPASSSVWDALAECETGGNWSENSVPGYSGGLGFANEYWDDFGGQTAYPWQASKAHQIEVAERILAANGWGAWPACSRKLGLR